MPDYGKPEYWDERYAAEETEKDSAFADPFDWLFSYSDVGMIIEHLLPKKDIDALLIGCGNAPFSIDVSDIFVLENTIRYQVIYPVLHRNPPPVDVQ